MTKLLESDQLPNSVDKSSEILKKNWDLLSTHCIAIYRGGSMVDSVIDHPHDYDYICFAKNLHWQRLLRKLRELGLRTSGSKKTKQIKDTLSLSDFSQVRVYPYTQITWFSYLDNLMEKVIGENVCPKTDIIEEHRNEFILELKRKMTEISSGRIKNQKRWYHLLRGAYIVINKSYEVTPEQRIEINTLHDLSEGWEKVRDKTIEILKKL